MDNKIYFVCSKYTVLLENVWWGSCCNTLWTLTQLLKLSLKSGVPSLQRYMVARNVTMQQVLVFWSCSILSFINWTFVDILQLLSGCMHPLLSITGSTVCQFCFFHFCMCMYVHVCFFMKSLTHDFDYIDYFVTFVLCWKDSSTSKSNFKINNLNRVCRKDMLLRTLCMRTPNKWI